ncbi:uncharacterized protein LOC110259520 [Sus scrofa]|uniref:uncharacterized protein LOC110259520 n=1 Tax=Sus scrofa TaxID=9823 RepID=UPI000A2B153E|nr:uncharacterized protein LOC110259520 [Sus scrofa]
MGSKLEKGAAAEEQSAFNSLGRWPLARASATPRALGDLSSAPSSGLGVIDAPLPGYSVARSLSRPPTGAVRSHSLHIRGSARRAPPRSRSPLPGCVSAVRRAMATTTSGFRHFVLPPPTRAAKLRLFYKPGSSQPANTY